MGAILQLLRAIYTILGNEECRPEICTPGLTIAKPATWSPGFFGRDSEMGFVEFFDVDRTWNPMD